MYFAPRNRLNKDTTRLPKMIAEQNIVRTCSCRDLSANGHRVKSNVMEPTKELIDDIYRERVRRARRMTPGERLIAGPRLFDDVCAMVKAGIRGQFPEFSEEQVEQEFLRRLSIARRLENHD